MTVRCWLVDDHTCCNQGWEGIVIALVSVGTLWLNGVLLYVVFQLM